MRVGRSGVGNWNFRREVLKKWLGIKPAITISIRLATDGPPAMPIEAGGRQPGCD